MQVRTPDSPSQIPRIQSSQQSPVLAGQQDLGLPLAGIKHQSIPEGEAASRLDTVSSDKSASESAALRFPGEANRVSNVHEVRSEPTFSGRHQMNESNQLPRSLSTPDLFGIVQSDQWADIFLDAMDESIGQLSEDSQRGGVSQGVFLKALTEKLTEKAGAIAQVQPYLRTLLPVATAFVQEQYDASRRSGWGSIKRSLQNLTSRKGGNGSAKADAAGADDRRLSLTKLDRLVRNLRQDPSMLEKYFYDHSALVRKPNESVGKKRVTFAPTPHLASKVNSWPRGSLMLAEQMLGRVDGGKKGTGWVSQLEGALAETLLEVDEADISPITPGFLRAFVEWVGATPNENKVSLTEFRNRLPDTLHRYESSVDWSDGRKKRLTRSEILLNSLENEDKNPDYDASKYYSIFDRVLNHDDWGQATEDGLDKKSVRHNESENLVPLCPTVVAHYMPHLKEELVSQLKKAPSLKSQLPEELKSLKKKHNDILQKLQNGEYDNRRLVQLQEKRIAKRRRSIDRKIVQLPRDILNMERLQSTFPEEYTPEEMIKRFPKLFDPKIVSGA